MGKKDKNKGIDGLPGDDVQTTVKKAKGGLIDPSSGDQFKMADNLGALILVEAKEFESGFITENGPADIVRGNITVLTEDDGKTALDDPTEYNDTIIFGRAVVGSLKSAVGTGSLVVGTVAQGEKKPGKNAPWLIKPATEKQRAIAEKHLG